MVLIEERDSDFSPYSSSSSTDPPRIPPKKRAAPLAPEILIPVMSPTRIVQIAKSFIPDKYAALRDIDWSIGAKTSETQSGTRNSQTARANSRIAPDGSEESEDLAAPHHRERSRDSSRRSTENRSRNSRRSTEKRSKSSIISEDSSKERPKNFAAKLPGASTVIRPKIEKLYFARPKSGSIDQDNSEDASEERSGTINSSGNRSTKLTRQLSEDDSSDTVIDSDEKRSRADSVDRSRNRSTKLSRISSEDDSSGTVIDPDEKRSRTDSLDPYGQRTGARPKNSAASRRVQRPGADSVDRSRNRSTKLSRISSDDDSSGTVIDPDEKRSRADSLDLYKQRTGARPKNSVASRRVQRPGAVSTNRSKNRSTKLSAQFSEDDSSDAVIDRGQKHSRAVSTKRSKTFRSRRPTEDDFSDAGIDRSKGRSLANSAPSRHVLRSKAVSVDRSRNRSAKLSRQPFQDDSSDSAASRYVQRPRANSLDRSRNHSTTLSKQLSASRHGERSRAVSLDRSKNRSTKLSRRFSEDDSSDSAASRYVQRPRADSLDRSRNRSTKLPKQLSEDDSDRFERRSRAGSINRYGERSRAVSGDRSSRLTRGLSQHNSRVSGINRSEEGYSKAHSADRYGERAGTGRDFSRSGGRAGSVSSNPSRQLVRVNSFGSHRASSMQLSKANSFGSHRASSMQLSRRYTSDDSGDDCNSHSSREGVVRKFFSRRDKSCDSSPYDGKYPHLESMSVIDYIGRKYTQLMEGDRPVTGIMRRDIMKKSTKISKNMFRSMMRRMENRS